MKEQFGLGGELRNKATDALLNEVIELTLPPSLQYFVRCIKEKRDVFDPEEVGDGGLTTLTIRRLMREFKNHPTHCNSLRSIGPDAVRLVDELESLKEDLCSKKNEIVEFSKQMDDTMAESYRSIELKQLARLVVQSLADNRANRKLGDIVEHNLLEEEHLDCTKNLWESALCECVAFLKVPQVDLVYAQLEKDLSTARDVIEESEVSITSKKAAIETEIEFAEYEKKRNLMPLIKKGVI
eukprot:TRINITY_DN2193_c0_g3_i3.p1 TRINITY_DN2193_c0_g3~~TRINITY_DN2193_c0_g3_i3.p1  ORF type:complete len:240 (+),score=13.65 TRINITY_DN2193_c0_g3_i3:853-1572(+)